MIKTAISTALVACVSIFATAHAATPAEDAIKHRQAGYTYMGWNMGKIKSMVVDKPETFNKDKVAAAANVIAAIANSGMGELYPADSKSGSGFKPTRVKAEFWQQQDRVREVAMTFNKEANELAKVAAGGDVAAIKAQFGKVGQSCKACHDDFRTKE